MSSVLPLEIWLLVFDVLGHDRSNLSLLSLVCKAWSCYARPLLFRETRVKLRRYGRYGGESDLWSQFTPLLESPSSTLPVYVENLWLHGWNTSGNSCPFDAPSVLGHVGKLVNLREIRFMFADFAVYDGEVDDGPESLETDVSLYSSPDISFLALSNLTALVFHICDFPSMAYFCSLILSARNLLDLTVTKCSAMDYSCSDLNPRINAFRSVRLLDNHTNFDEAIYAWFNQHNPPLLIDHFTCRKEPSSVLETYLSSARHFREVLHTRAPIIIEGKATIYRSAGQRRFKTEAQGLERFQAIYFGHCNNITEMTRFPRFIKSHTNLVELYLQLDVLESVSTDSIIRELGELDVMLLDPGLFRMLQAVEVVIVNGMGSKLDLIDAMPRCTAAGVRISC